MDPASWCEFERWSWVRENKALGCLHAVDGGQALVSLCVSPQGGGFTAAEGRRDESARGRGGSWSDIEDGAARSNGENSNGRRWMDGRVEEKSDTVRGSAWRVSTESAAPQAAKSCPRGCDLLQACTRDQRRAMLPWGDGAGGRCLSFIIMSDADGNQIKGGEAARVVSREMSHGVKNWYSVLFMPLQADFRRLQRWGEHSTSKLRIHPVSLELPLPGLPGQNKQ